MSDSTKNNLSKKSAFLEPPEGFVVTDRDDPSLKRKTSNSEVYHDDLILMYIIILNHEIND